MTFVGTETGEASRVSASSTELLTRPLTVCLVSPVSAQANGGTAAYIRYLGAHLSKAGHRVSGVARLRTDIKRNLTFEDSDANHEGDLVEHGLWKTKLIAPHHLYKPLLGHLVKFMTRPGLERFAVSAFISAYQASLARAMPEDVDVVHYTGTGWELLPYAALAVARQRGAAFTMMPFVHPGEWGDSALDTRLYNQADAVFVCSGYEQKFLEGKGVRPANLRRTGVAPASEITGNAADFRERHKLGNRPLILFLGRKQRYKGYHALCQAMTKVAEAVPDVCLVVAGPNGELPCPDIPAGVFLDLGELTPEPHDARHKADALSACDLFCMPSTAEAFGIVYVEAWANGMPVVAGMAPAVQELVENNVNGYRVTQDPEEIADVLIALLKDPLLRKRLGQAGFEKQQTYFTWSAVTEQHVNVFRQMALRNAS